MKAILSCFILIILLNPIQSQDIFRTTCQGNLSRLDSILLTMPIDTQDRRQRSILHWAVACDRDTIINYLIDKDINLNIEDDQNKTAMHMCIRFNETDYFDLLAHHQKDDSWKTQFGASMLCQAILKRDSAFVNKLLDYGIDINIKNDRGTTPLELSQKIKADNITSLLLNRGADKNLVRSFNLKGEYLGQTPPNEKALVFAPNFISTEEYEFGSVFNKAGNIFYYGVDTGNQSEIRMSRLENGKWTQPQIILSHPDFGFNDPFLSPDESRLYFISQKPLQDSVDRNDYNIWYVQKENESWSDPISAGPMINTKGNEYYISFTHDGTMYFSSNKNAGGDNGNNLDIYYSKFKNGDFQKAVVLGDAINTEHYEADVFIDPQEEYIIFCSTRPGGLGRGDLYISFKNDTGAWTDSVNMGEKINSKHHELCPFVTADGQYFFYTSDEDIYWIHTQVFDELRSQSK